ncbi:DUF1489 family protein [Sphingomonas sabuli]|uniref:DUF1489 family protein n=1 Tax=Sphingomonas sabuli TaxID=2764186 RepID=A0A7G9L0U4_9SPHN|nr:DUF1489 family protein [Sphingomonas sabuli]QNM82243.1 DUF1489 family protein [Sphingomonas sabuli]
MPLHLSKVAFACRDADALARRIATRASGGELRVATRMRPRRADELVGGSLYWIVKHRLIGCNEILRLEDRSDGRIDIVCAETFRAVVPKHRRAHQGWRYLTEEDAPAAEDDGSGLSELPPRLYGRLAALALL